MKTSLKQQQGLSGISIIMIIAVVVSIFMLALKIGPIYLEHGKVTSGLNSIKDNPEAVGETPAQLSIRLIKVLGINDVTSVGSDNIDIVVENGMSRITVEYEVVKKITGNLSALVEFKDSVEIRNK